MNGIIGFSELALLKEMPADIRDYLTKINRASTNLLSILNDILDLSKLEANGVSLNLVLFDLDELRDTLYSLFAETAQNKSLIFNIKIPAQVPRQLIGDDLRLKQVLINLLSNAVKFTAIGAVSLDISLLDSEASKTRLLFSVNDTGIGLSAQDQEKLFQPFTQADDSIARRFGGTGLGLALSHNLLQLMGSEFTVVSTPGLGSCFSFELVLDISATSHVAKAKQPLATTASALKDFAPRLAGTQILVAEDNFFNQQIIQELLKLASIKVEIANNGAEALAMLESGEFDAILMDVHMPVMDGLEATQQIRRSLRFADIPVIALTAGVTQAEREQCLASGMNDFINKPINMTQLLSTLAQWTKPQHL
jgi:CheY-like chemotaxis protein